MNGIRCGYTHLDIYIYELFYSWSHTDLFREDRFCTTRKSLALVLVQEPLALELQVDSLAPEDVTEQSVAPLRDATRDSVQESRDAHLIEQSILRENYDLLDTLVEPERQDAERQASERQDANTMYVIQFEANRRFDFREHVHMHDKSDTLIRDPPRSRPF